PYTAYSHGASVGNINKDGFPDILLLHASIPSSPNPYVAVLMNNGDGSFTRDDGRLPVELRHNPYTAELLDVNGDGNLDALISSYDDVSPDGPPPTRIFWGKNDGIFDTTHPQLLPQNLLCRSTLHLTKHLNNLYALRVCDGYTNNIVQRIQIGTWKDQIVWNEPAPYLGWGSGPFGWLDWLNFDNGQFIHDRVPGVRIKP
ncbi:MAG: FG-GAP repeat domain-containing protein, partial [Bacteroidota bacterium]